MRDDIAILENVTKEISSILNIKPPEIVVDNSVFLSKTQLAAADITSYTIAIKPACFDPRDSIFAIAHELRHLWQVQNEAGIFENYKGTSDKRDINDYNWQEAELDANAFATYIMVDMFSVRPLFKGLPDELIKCIYTRAAEIRNEFKK